MIPKSLNYIPMHPAEWRRLARNMIAIHGVSKIAKGLGITEDELRKKLEDNPERDEREYMDGVKRCIEYNPNFTLEEIAWILEIPVEKLM